MGHGTARIFATKPRQTCSGVALLAALLVPLCEAVAQHEHTAQHDAAAEPSCIALTPDPHCGAAPTPAFGPEDGLWVAFAHEGHVYVARSGDIGRSFEPAVRVNAVPEALDVNGESRPKIAFGRRGEVYVSWTKKLPGGYHGDVRFSRSSDTGKSFTPPVTINDDGLETGHRFESLHVDRSGDLYLVWLDKRDQVAAQDAGEPYVGAAVYYTVSTDGGRSFAPNRRVADESCECCRIAVADAQPSATLAPRHGERQGGAAIFWRHVFGRSTRDHAFALLGGDGSPSSVRRITHDGWEIEACPHHGPAMISARGGGYHLAWFTGGEARRGIFYGRYSPATGALEQVAAIASAPSASHAHLGEAAGRVMLAWKEFDGVETHVRVVASEDGGATWSEPRSIARSQSASDHPFVLTHGGRAFVSWHTQAEGLRIVPVGDGARGGAAP